MVKTSTRFSPQVHMGEREIEMGGGTDSWKLTSGLHMYAVAHAHAYMHTHHKHMCKTIFKNPGFYLQVNIEQQPEQLLKIKYMK